VAATTHYIHASTTADANDSAGNTAERNERRNRSDDTVAPVQPVEPETSWLEFIERFGLEGRRFR
jgi:hypothetical protein